METGVKKIYEIMFLIDSAEAAKDWDGIMDLVTKMLNKIDAQIITLKKWDERPLAYSIKRCSRGTYILAYFKADGRMEITDPDHANALLLGTVVTYQLEPLLMDVHNTPEQYKMRMILYLALKDIKAGKNLWVEENFEDSVTYYAANNLNMPVEAERDARKRLIQKLSTRLLARVIEGF